MTSRTVIIVLALAIILGTIALVVTGVWMNLSGPLQIVIMIVTALAIGALGTRLLK